ncbi:hypothetical protein D3C81_890920 [compost metagenome]
MSIGMRVVQVELARKSDVGRIFSKFRVAALCTGRSERVAKNKRKPTMENQVERLLDYFRL